MIPTTWHRSLGIRPDEGKTVWLFFLHNFLLGIGTILVYVSANVILLENNPERNLPLAYGVAALAMMVVGRVYTYYEHHLLLQKLAVRVLLAVVALTGVLGVLVVVGHSVAAAVAIMAGYRVIYLLTNLEFWGVSAVVFDVRQGRRLFSIISSGDMPAKALGAVLAILIHAHTDLLYLLLTAFGAYLGALYTLRTTLRSHVIDARAAPRRERRQAMAAQLQRWFGNSRMVLSVCLSMTAIAAVTTGVEFAFFVNVKHKFHDQATVMQYVGSVLAVTYLLAMLFKLLLSGQLLDRLGVRWTLVTLPVVVLSGIFVFYGLWLTGVGESALLLYFCGLYLVMEVLRRGVFDPVFLVLFQPLSPPERLQAHTLAKGFFEPLGMALAGLLLFGLHRFPQLSQWAPFGWMGLLMVGALYLLHHTYGHYLTELQHSLSRRFSAEDGEPEPDQLLTDAEAAPTEADTVPDLLAALRDKATRAPAADRLIRLGAAALPALREVLATTSDEALVRRVAHICGRIPLPASREALVALARQPNLFRREVALRALRSFAPVAADAAGFQALVQEEMRLAQHLLHGLDANPDEDLASALQYELTKVEQRVFGLLLQLYPPHIIADAQRGVAHATRERQANALEILDNIIPRSVYQGLQALLDMMPISEKIATFDALFGSIVRPVAVVPGIVQRGEAAFSDWTISVALRQWHPTAGTLPALLPHLASASLLIRESALAVLAALARQQPGLHRQFLADYPTLTASAMSHSATTAHISAAERVNALKNTALFAETPENVLSSIVPIMKEVSFVDGQLIFAKGELGTSLFIPYEGEVGIFNGPQRLATFRKGDFFGELALLDAEPRSASAIAQGHVVAFRLDQEDFYDVMEERGEVLRNILRVLCQRLRRQNEKIHQPIGTA
ncbi:Cyclic nucleotide-binding domain-containing protein [Hymenobacter daecheongensis DSM 21074]|uniref:Cyclic nucleotide-binding domain-containing protein n=1 Tax=Hymenobacter daecheongensis DSM 21074 TaxID=1121955 RepID=A0A1M6MCW8_9BACT|nr:cyclic nucleotide-binding domain-containing protein [Hymenobacter daecheongensis]SHJ81338.1 Cyclic nucleotide-binding domain-containing protein [Hymenobacter daecheongensis DSM 21074]